MNNQPIRVLQVVTVMNLGGLENFLMTLYRNIDRSKVQFDFLVHRHGRGAFDDEIESLGGKIYRFNPIRPHRYFQYKKQLKSFFESHKEYEIIHSHINENSAIVLNVAKKCGIPMRIAHSHAKATDGPFKFLREFLKRNISSYSTLNLACSKDAGVWLYGENKFNVFKNSIDVNRFKYPKNSDGINDLKKNLKIDESNYVLGLIASFSPVKNHTFLIDVFNEYHKTNPKSKLLLVGDGVLRKQLRQKVHNMGLDEVVVFTGNVSNPEDYLAVMDIFVMTSFNEGMPTVLIEAQCNGLPIVMSDTIPNEIAITDLIHKKSLESNANEWANSIGDIKSMYELSERVGYDKEITRKHFNIESNTQKLIDYYLLNKQ